VNQEEIAIHRRSGVRLLRAGFVLLVAGLIILVISDQRTGGAITHPEISRGGRGLSMLAGFPATLGYVLCALGLYRYIRGRGPGHDSQSLIVMVFRAVFAVLAAALFFVGAFWIVMAVRDPSAPVPRSPTP
jgi:hypothetical protein